MDIDNLMREFKPCIKHDRYEVSCISVYSTARSPPHFVLQVLYIPVAYSIKEGRLVHSCPYLHGERLSSQSPLITLLPHHTPPSFSHTFVCSSSSPHIPIQLLCVPPSYLLHSPMSPHISPFNSFVYPLPTSCIAPCLPRGTMLCS